jgi:superfamily II DNA or RNA helicase
VTFQLRDYQLHTVAANRAAHTGARRPTGVGVVNRTGNILATGLGKTEIFSAQVARAHARLERSIILVHRQELADQAIAKLRKHSPNASIGLVKAGRNDWEADIVLASVPSIGTERQLRKRRIPSDWFQLGIADECHHASADTWRTAMDYFGAFRGTPWSGYTATMARGDTRALGDIWSEIVSEYDIAFGVSNGYLVRPRGKRIRVKSLMLDEVKRSRGDYQDSDLGDAMEDADAGSAIAEAYLEHCPGLRAAMFCPNVSSAQHFAGDFNRAGISAEVVVGTTTDVERKAIFARFESGETLVIAGVGVLTEGWDAPWCEVVIMARPTQSAGLYVQCVGRGLRPSTATGKTECLVLDVVGVTANHRLVSLKDLAGRDAEGREMIPDPYGDLVEDDGTGNYAPPIKERPDGQLVAEEVELFAESRSAWLQTDRGVWFIPTKDYLFFLFRQDDDLFSVGRVSTQGGKASRLERDTLVETGKKWAEMYATELDASISGKYAPWRSKSPSDALVKKATGLGILVHGGMRQGEISDMISTRYASSVLAKFANRKEVAR